MSTKEGVENVEAAKISGSLQVDGSSLTDQEKIELSVLLEEFKISSAIISQQIQIQSQIATIGMTIIAAGGGALVSMIAANRDTYLVWVLLFLPLFLSNLGMWIVNKDDAMIDHATYNNEILRKRISELCGQPVLMLEVHLIKRRKGANYSFFARLSRWSGTIFPHSLFGLVCLCCLIVIPLNHLSPVQIVIYIVDFLFFVFFFISAIAIPKRYAMIDSLNEEKPVVITKVPDSKPLRRRKLSKILSKIKIFSKKQKNDKI
jgi:hypothetical protein